MRLHTHIDRQAIRPGAPFFADASVRQLPEIPSRVQKIEQIADGSAVEGRVTDGPGSGVHSATGETVHEAVRLSTQNVMVAAELLNNAILYLSDEHCVVPGKIYDLPANAPVTEALILLMKARKQVCQLVRSADRVEKAGRFAAAGQSRSTLYSKSGSLFSRFVSYLNLGVHHESH